MAAPAFKPQNPAKEQRTSSRLASRPKLVTQDAAHAASPSPASLLQANLQDALIAEPRPLYEKWSPRRALATMIGVSLALWAGIGVGAVLVARQLF